MNEKVTVSMEKRVEQLNNLLLAQKSDLTINYELVWKNNERFDAYVLVSGQNNCCPTIYYNDDWYQKSDEEVVGFLKKMAATYGRTIDKDEFLNRDYLMSHVLPRLVSSSNEYDLKVNDIAYIKFLDMCILFFVPVDEFLSDGAFTVKNHLLELLDITLDDIKSAAIHNLESQVEIKNMMEVLTQMEKFDFPVLEIGFLPMWVCTNTSKHYGAAVMLCPSVIRELEKVLGNTFFFLPSSIHDVIAVPYDEDEDAVHGLADIVNVVNTTAVNLEDMLTDSVYIFKNGTLMIAE